jgi:hypothetical protein
MSCERKSIIKNGKMIYYHIDKSGLIDSNLREKKGSMYMISGTESLNSFPYGFMTVESARLIPSILSKYLHKKISDFYKKRDLKDIENIISEVVLNKDLINDIYIQRILREILFEEVRLSTFEDIPSRLSCIYLIENLKDIEKWAIYLKVNDSKYVTYKFESIKPNKLILGDFIIVESVHRADAKWLEINLNNIESVRRNAKQYWSGIFTREPLIEILYYGILKKIE